MVCVEGDFLKLQMQQKEDDVREHPCDTLRSLPEYTENLAFANEEEFIAYLVGDVLDCGSGYDGLAFDAQRRGLDCTIYSMNPARVIEENGVIVPNQIFLYERAACIHDSRNTRFIGVPDNKEYIEEILRTVDRHASADFAHNMKSFPSNKFDRILDNYAISFYSRTEEQDQAVFMLFLLEALRVLKVGGTLRIRDSFWNYTPGDPINFPAIADVLVGLGFMTYQRILSPEGTIRGVEITKVKHPEFLDHKD